MWDSPAYREALAHESEVLLRAVVGHVSFLLFFRCFGGPRSRPRLRLVIKDVIYLAQSLEEAEQILVQRL